MALAADLDAGTAGDRYQVVLHVEASASAGALAGAAGTPAGIECDGVLEVDDHAIHVSAETSRRLACDTAVVEIRHDAEGSVLDVGRRTRSIPVAIRRALIARDRRCRFPACSARRCDAHHIEHWFDGGPTSLDNLVLLCRRHHRMLHEGGFALKRQPDGSVAFFHEDGMPLYLAPPQPRIDIVDSLAPTTQRLAVGGITITTRTLPTWEGGPFNLAYALDALYVPRTHGAASS